jgi:hypothetical protein
MRLIHRLTIAVNLASGTVILAVGWAWATEQDWIQAGWCVGMGLLLLWVAWMFSNQR